MLERDGAEHPIPPELRPNFDQIAEAFAAGDFELRDHLISDVARVDAPTARFIANAVEAYGGTLVALHPAVWQRAVYRWMDGHWLLLVDLTTANEKVSDLTLHAKLYDAEHSVLEIQSVHVP